MPAEQNLMRDELFSLENAREDVSNLCGIVMPIAAMGDYSETHWTDVQNIIKEAVSNAGYEARLVSESADATVIIRSIVQNIYKDKIIICDVSGMNPNVMFELGMRLAFDKPVVIIKDEVTRFSFDISTIEHLVYPRSLRYQNIQDFKKKLTDKIKATVQASNQDNYRSFLTNFGSFTIANLQETTLNESEALERILTKLDKFDSRLVNLEHVKDEDFFLKSLKNLKILDSPERKYFYDVMRVHVPTDVAPVKFHKLTEVLGNKYLDSVRVTMSGINTSTHKTISISSVFEPTPSMAQQIKEIVDQIINED